MPRLNAAIHPPRTPVTVALCDRSPTSASIRLQRAGARVLGALTLALALSTTARDARAQAAGADSTASAASPVDTTSGGEGDDVASPQSPRANLAAFFALTSAGLFDSAAAYLSLAPAQVAEGGDLARKLRAVLDRRLRLDLERISGDAVGDTVDGLGRSVEQIGRITNPSGDSVTIRMVRVADAGSSDATAAGPRWQFGESTVAQIPVWYDVLEGRWALEHLPPVLLRSGPAGILWWQWIALVLLLVTSAGLGTVVGRIVRLALGRVARRTESTWDDEILERMTAPLTVAGTLLIFSAVLPALGLAAVAEALVYRLVRGALFIDFFWGLWRIVDVVRDVLLTAPWASEASSSRALIPLGARVAKVIVAAIALVATISMLGYPVASLIAGLGLGGLAFALAAQKTVENLFGAFSLGVDQPFREGDFVKIEEFVATVEAIGLRSTRFRTLDRTLISIPNGRLAEMRLESYTARDRLRLATTIGLVYDTTASQMQQVLEGFERVLREHPRIWPDAMVVRFAAFASSSLDIEIMAWFQTSVWSEFQLIRQEILLGFMAVVEEAGSSFAFPTQTLHLVRDGSAEQPPLPPDSDRARNGGSGAKPALR